MPCRAACVTPVLQAAIGTTSLSPQPRSINACLANRVQDAPPCVREESEGFMNRYIGAFLAILVTAGVGLGMIVTLNTWGQQPPAIHSQLIGPHSSSQGVVKQVSLTLQTYPFDPYEDPAFIASHVKNQDL